MVRAGGAGTVEVGAVDVGSVICQRGSSVIGPGVGSGVSYVCCPEISIKLD